MLGAVLQLAQVCRAEDDLSTARRLLEEAYAAGQWRYGDSDPLLLMVSFELGGVADDLGNRHEAKRAFGRVAAHGVQVLGGEHWAVRQALAYLGEDPPTVRLTLPEGGIEQLRGQVGRPGGNAVSAAPDPLRWADGAEAARYPEVVRPYSAAPGPVEREPGTGREPVRFAGASGGVGVPLPETLPEAVPAVRADGAGHGRGTAVFAAVAAGLAVLAAVVALVVVLARPGSEGDPGGKAVVAGAPPTDVTLTDSGASVALSWVDPSDGTVSFLITGGHRGQQLTGMGNVAAGRRSFELHALNPQINYCFAVLAVYGANQFAPSEPVCTNRVAGAPQPSPGQ